MEINLSDSSMGDQHADDHNMKSEDDDVGHNMGSHLQHNNMQPKNLFSPN